MLYEMGVNRDPDFNPDRYLDWEIENGYVLRYLNIEQQYFDGPIAYAANVKSKSITYMGECYDTSDRRIWQDIDEGYWTIVHVNDYGEHYILIDNAKSKATGTLYFYESAQNPIENNSLPLSNYSSRVRLFIYRFNPITANVDKGNDGVYVIGENAHISVSDTPFSTHTLKIYRTPPGGTYYLYYEGQNNQYDMPCVLPGHYSCVFSVEGNQQGSWVGWDVVDSSTEFTLNVDGLLDGASSGHTRGFGTFDVYIDGERVADDVADYYGAWPALTPYEIKDIRPMDGKSYAGISEGNRQGIINKSVTTVGLSFTTVPQSPGVDPITGTFGGHTYYYYPRASTWYEAKKLSENLGGHLVTINSAEEDAFVFSLAERNPVWIGLTDRDSEGTWTWVTGEPLNYTNWYPGQPDKSCSDQEGEESYVNYTAAKTGQWNDDSSFRLNGFVCEKEPGYPSGNYTLKVKGLLNSAYVDDISGWGTFDVYIEGDRVADDVSAYSGEWPANTEYEIKDIRALSGKSYSGICEGTRMGTISRNPTNVSLQFTTVPDNPGVTPTVQTWGGHTYYYYPSASTWYEAKTYSENLGGHLVTINSAEEDAFVFGLAGQDSVWIGLSSVGDDGIWTWVTGEPLTYTNWYPGQPDRSVNDNEGNESFVHYTAAKTGQWNDNGSFRPNGFVCEVEPEYTASFAGNGGSGTMPDLTVRIGTSITLPECAFIPPADQQFKAWQIGGVEYAPGTAYVIIGNVTVTALWESIPIEPDFILPEDLTEIGEEAFAGCAFAYVRLSEHVERIGNLAFADCPNLLHIYIPEAANSIASDAFSGVSASMVIHGKANSYAEIYASQYGFGFIAE